MHFHAGKFVNGKKGAGLGSQIELSQVIPKNVILFMLLGPTKWGMNLNCFSCTTITVSILFGEKRNLHVFLSPNSKSQQKT